MKNPALVAVDSGPEAFEALFDAARRRGVRIGWLDFAAPAAAPASLGPALISGAAKAVAVGGEGSIAVKRRRGAPVLRDLLREHFLGYVLVLITGREDRPRLTPSKGGFRLVLGADRVLELGADAVLAELMRPVHRA